MELDVYPRNHNKYENNKEKGPLKICVRFGIDSLSNISFERIFIHPKAQELGAFLQKPELFYIQSILLSGPFSSEVKEFIKKIVLGKQIAYVPENVGENTDIQYRFMLKNEGGKQEITISIPVGFFEDSTLPLYIKTRELS